MIKIVGVRLRPCGKPLFFDPGDLRIRLDDNVIVQTEKGEEFGTVAIVPSCLPEELVQVKAEELKPVLRVADEEDINIHVERIAREREARKIFIEKVEERQLEMKLVNVEMSFDGSHIIFYFSAEGRVDFRELVKDLAGMLHMRIELRQIGVRDETRMLGGFGTCGRPLCCNAYLKDFAPVTIKMAKTQNLSLNPTKISGCCGRLMCCLRNESDVYEELNKNLPKRGTVVTTSDGFVGVSIETNILKQTVKVLVDMDNDEKEMREYSIEQLKFTPGIKRPVRKADQRPVQKSVVAAAAKVEAQKKARLVAEERQAAEEIAAHDQDDADNKDTDARDGEKAEGRSRRRRSRRRGGEGENRAERIERSERSDKQDAADRAGRQHRAEERKKRAEGRRDKSAADGEDSKKREARSRRRRPDRHGHPENVKDTEGNLGTGETAGRTGVEHEEGRSSRRRRRPERRGEDAHRTQNKEGRSHERQEASDHHSERRNHTDDNKVSSHEGANHTPRRRHRAGRNSGNSKGTDDNKNIAGSSSGSERVRHENSRSEGDRS